MTGNQYRFDRYLPNVNADKLKPMVRMWGGDSKLRKAECIEVIKNGLSDPAKVRAAVQGLEPWEQTALAILKTFGNSIETAVLNIAIRATGIPLSHHISRPGRNDKGAVVSALFSRGLILSGGGDPGYFSSYSYSSTRVFTDERLTAAVGPLNVQPFDIKPIPTPKDSIYRRPPTVVLDVIGLLQAISDMGGLGLTKNGDLRVAAVKSLRQTMKWPEKGIHIDGIFFPDPALAWVNAFRHSDLLVLGDGFLTLRESPEFFATRSYRDQVEGLLDGFSRSEAWSETSMVSSNYRYQSSVNHGRQALLIGLQSLPLDSGGFFSIDDFELALFNRIGEHFSLGYLPDRPYFFRNENAAQQKQKIEEWHTKLRDNWLSKERTWIIEALKTWAYFLGLVELALAGDKIMSFRLTALGRDILHPQLAAKPGDSASTPKTESPSWVVQPNFDVVAYLEHISAPQLAFLERFAEREKADQHTALFRLTRHSVYRGLEGGATLEALLQGLGRGADVELPQNVITELRDWAALREQITLHHRAKLLEFSDEQSLEKACQGGLKGKVIGDRFLLLTGKVSQFDYFHRKNYIQALPSCLAITEQGKIRIQAEYHDLWIAAQLDQWAEPVSGDWQLTAASVKAAHQSGKSLTNFLNLLSARLKKSLPKFTRLALWAWVGRPLNAELGNAIILRCPDDEVFQAVISSQQLRPFVQGILTQNTLLVNPGDMEQVADILRWAGLEVSTQFEVSR